MVLLDNIVEYVVSGQTTVLGDSKGYYFGTQTSNPGYSGNRCTGHSIFPVGKSWYIQGNEERKDHCNYSNRWCISW